jgi:hypothetical protein
VRIFCGTNEKRARKINNKIFGEKRNLTRAGQHTRFIEAFLYPKIMAHILSSSI